MIKVYEAYLPRIPMGHWIELAGTEIKMHINYRMPHTGKLIWRAPTDRKEPETQEEHWKNYNHTLRKNQSSQRRAVIKPTKDGDRAAYARIHALTTGSFNSFNNMQRQVNYLELTETNSRLIILDLEKVSFQEALTGATREMNLTQDGPSRGWALISGLREASALCDHVFALSFADKQEIDFHKPPVVKNRPGMKAWRNTHKGDGTGWGKGRVRHPPHT